MKKSKLIFICVSKIIENQRFVKDILYSVAQCGGKVLLVGGAVRDILLQRSIQDLDFEVYGLTLQQLQNILEQYGPVSLIGKSFGVLRLHGLDIDWSLPRKDSSGRHPTVSYDPYMSYKDAFARRDLTINAMGIDMQSFVLIDPFGGQKDLEYKILRSPDLDFFPQDPLRLLRVMQFVGRFAMQVDEKLSQLCSVIDISQVSCERIEQEFSKLFLQAKQPSQGLRWIVQIKKFNELLPQVVPGDDLWKNIDDVASQKYNNDQEKIVVMWAVIMSHMVCNENRSGFAEVTRKDKKIYVDFMKSITRHEKIAQQAINLVLYAKSLHGNMTDAQIKWLAVWLGPDVSLRFLLHFFAVRYDAKIGQILTQKAKKINVLDTPEKPLLTGKDFLDVAQGAKIGVLVKQSYQLQIDHGIADRDELKKLVTE